MSAVQASKAKLLAMGDPKLLASYPMGDTSHLSCIWPLQMALIWRKTLYKQQLSHLLEPEEFTLLNEVQLKPNTPEYNGYNTQLCRDAGMSPAPKSAVVYSPHKHEGKQSNDRLHLNN